MTDPVHPDLATAVDQVLDPVWRSARRRHRRRRWAEAAARVATLLAVVAVLSFALGLPLSLPEILFFTGLGIFCVLAPETGAGAPGRSGPPGAG